MDIQVTVKTLLSQGVSRRQIASQLGIHRKVVRRIERDLESGKSCGHYTRQQKLAGYKKIIEDLLAKEWSAELIHDHLVREHMVQVSYVTVSRLVRVMKADKEVFIPMLCAPGEEAQVDFGYLGVFTGPDGSKHKVWVFCLVLSHSRMSYQEVVTDQSVETFIACHIRAFEALLGVPRAIRLDNLKAGVTVPDFYEPLIQEQYAAFLAHYGAVAVPCRVRTPEHKGKVESGVKYVKGNFLPRLNHRDFSRLKLEIQQWTDNVANRRTHGTTKRVPVEVWQQVERQLLLPLPDVRYEFYQVEERKVNRFGHVTYRNNYYSVPWMLVGQTLRLQSNGTMLRIFANGQEVALHLLSNQDKGQYITQPAHQPPHKQVNTPEHLAQKLLEQIGAEALDWMKAVQQQNPSHWREKVNGLFHLIRLYPPEFVRQACRRALDNHLYAYRSVRDICHQLDQTKEPAQDHSFQAPPPGIGGMAHDLAIYDRLGP